MGAFFEDATFVIAAAGSTDGTAGLSDITQPVHAITKCSHIIEGKKVGSFNMCRSTCTYQFRASKDQSLYSRG